MIVLAWFPPLWRRVMDHRLLDHYDGDVSRANIQPRARSAAALGPLRRRPRRERLPLPRLRLRLRRGGRPPARGLPAGHAWSEVPDDWACPDCGVRDKVDFEPVELTATSDRSRCDDRGAVAARAPPTRRRRASCCATRCSTPPATSCSSAPGRRSRWPTSPPPRASAARRSTRSSAAATSSPRRSSSARPNASSTPSTRPCASTSTIPRAAIGGRPRGLPAHRRRGPAGPHPAQRRRHRRACCPSSPPRACRSCQWATARLTATIEQGWPQAPPPKAQPARREPRPPRDQLRHRPRRVARGDRRAGRRAARPLHRRGAGPQIARLRGAWGEKARRSGLWGAVLLIDTTAAGKADGTIDGMRTTIDNAGRVVIPKTCAVP